MTEAPPASPATFSHGVPGVLLCGRGLSVVPGMCDDLPSRVLKTPATGIETQSSSQAGKRRHAWPPCAERPLEGSGSRTLKPGPPQRGEE